MASSSRTITTLLPCTLSRWGSAPPFPRLPALAALQCNPGVPELHAILSIAGTWWLSCVPGLKSCWSFFRSHSVAWLEQGMKTQRHCFQWSNPLYSNSTAFLSRIPKPPLLCEGFFFFFFFFPFGGKKRRRKKKRKGFKFVPGSLCWPRVSHKSQPGLSALSLIINTYN